MNGVVVYHLAFLLASVSGFFDRRHFKLGAFRFQSSLGIYISFIVIIALTATRDFVGTDYKTYVAIFRIAQSVGSYKLTEPGYFFLNKLFVAYENGYRIVLFIFAFSTYALFFFVAIRERVTRYFVPFLFGFGFIFFSNNIVRQSFTIGLFYYALGYLVERRFFPYLIISLFGALIHMSALLLIPLYWLLNLRFSKFFWAIAILGSVVALKFNVFNSIFHLIAKLFPKYYSTLNSISPDNDGLGLTLYFLIIMGYVVLLFSRHLPLQDKTGQVFLKVFMIGICLSIMVFSSEYFYRLTFYFFFSIVFLVPKIINSIPSKLNKTLSFLLFFRMCQQLIYLRGKCWSLLLSICFFLERWFYKRHKIAYKIMRLFDFIRFQKSKL